jgi:hypothetical protein
MRKSELSSDIKFARDIMRKDTGLSTDVDRIPQLACRIFRVWLWLVEIVGHEGGRQGWAGEAGKQNCPLPFAAGLVELRKPEEWSIP